MRKLLLVLALALLPLQAWGQGVVGPRSLQAASSSCALATDCLPLGVEGYGSAAVQLIFTGTGTAVVEGSINGQLFTALTMSQVGGSGNVTSATGTGSWSVNVAGMTQVRVRLSVCTSCTVVAMLQATRSGGGASGGGGGGGDASAANQSTQITSLQLIDDIVFAEDTAATAADKGAAVLAVRRDADTTLVGTDNDYANLQVNAGGQLKVACITGCSGGTSYTQDAAVTIATSSGSMAMGRASAAAPTAVSADDDAVLPWYLLTGAQAVQPTFGGVLAVAGNGASGTGVQRVTIANDSTGTVALTTSSAVIGHVIVDSGAGGGTQYTQDAALTVGTSVGTMAMGRASAAVPTDVSADGDATLPWYLRSGAQATQPTFGGVLASAGNGVSGTGVQRVTLASDSTGTVAATQSGTWNVGTVSTVTALTTLGTVTNVVHVDDNAGSLTVDNGGTFAVQAAGTKTNNNAAPGATNVGALTVLANASAPTWSEGNLVALSADLTGALRVSGGGGGTQYTQDAALTVGSTVGTIALGRASAAVPTDVSADNDAVIPWYLRSGALATQPTFGGVLAVAGNGAAGTGVQRVTIASDSTGVIGATQSGTWNVTNVSGTVSLPTGAATAANQSTIITSVQLIDDVVFAEDVAASAADKGVSVLAVRRDADTTLVGADNDYAQLQVNAGGQLKVACITGCAGSGGTSATDDADFTDGSSTFTLAGAVAEIASPSTVTEGDMGALAMTLNRALKVTLYATDGTALTPSQDQTEDAAAAGGETGPMILTVRRDTAASSAGTDGDFATLNTDASGRLWVNCGTGCSGGTQYTQDAALTVGTSVVTLAGGRASAAAPTDVSADNDAVMPWYLRSGAQVTQPTFAGVLATTGNGASGTGVQRVTIANDSTGIVALTTGSATIGALTANQSVNVAQINGVTTLMGAGNTGTGSQRVTIATDQAAMVGLGIYAEDAAETAGGNLAMSGTVRRDTAASSAGASGDNSTLNTDALGKLWVSGAYAEDAAHASGDLGLAILTKRTDTAAASAGTDGDYQTLNTDASGRLWVNCGTGCSGGTQYTEDAASAGGETLTLAGAVRQNTLSSAVSADGDYAYLKVDTLGSMYVNPFGATQAAATYLTVRLSDGTNFLASAADQTEDAASAGGEAGPMVLTVRRDSATTSAGTDGDFATLNTDGSGRLWVNCGTGCSGGTQYTQDAALTVATSVVTIAGGRASAAAPTDVSADNDAVMPWYLRSGAIVNQPSFAGVLATTGNGVSGTGVQRVTLASDSTGALATVSTVTTLSQLGGVALPIEDAAETAAGVGIYAMGVRRDTPASSAGTTGDNTMASYNNVGAQWVAQIDPCSSEAKVTAPFSLTARGIIVAAAASKKNYICAISVVAGAAEILNIVEGTGTTCQTGTAAIAGSTTAANGLSFAANGGMAAIGSNSTVLAGITSNVDTCIMPSGSNRLSGFVTYAQR